MSPQLRAMLVGVGVFALGVGVAVYTPQPATRTMLDLKDAGILDGQRLVIECPERLTRQSIRRINANQSGLLRPAQAYAHIARTARCFNPDGGNCLRPADGGLLIADLEGELVIPSLRVNLAGVDLDAGIAPDDGGDSDTVDDSFQYANTSCSLLTCPQYDALVDAGTRPNPYASASFCGALNRLALIPSPCMLPNPWKNSTDGGWSEVGTVDCKFGGPYAESDGGPRWRGFNVGPVQYAVGADCLPSECVIVSGDPVEWL